MKFISFDPLRTLGIANTTYLKPDKVLQHLEQVRSADCLLFPEYWQVNFLHHALHKPLFPSLSTYQLGHDKVEMTRAMMAAFPQHLPLTHICVNTAAAREEVLEIFDYPFIAKEIRSSQGNGVHLIHSRTEWLEYCNSNTVLYVQEYLPIQRDLRIVLVGREVVTSYWRENTTGDFHNNLSKGGVALYDNIPDGAVGLVKSIATQLDVDHAGFDIAEINGKYFFLEFNRLFGNSGLQSLSPPLAHYIEQYLHQRYPTQDDHPRAA